MRSPLTTVDVKDGLDGVHDPHEGDHDAKDVDAGPGHVHHKTVHHHRLARPKGDLHRPLFQRRNSSAHAMRLWVKVLTKRGTGQDRLYKNNSCYVPLLWQK